MAEQENKLPVGCFAPPLTDATLAEYEQMIAGLGDDRAEIKDYMRQCLDCVRRWWDLPESKRTDGKTFDIRHKGKPHTFRTVPLENAHVEALWDATPWMNELVAMERVFDTLPHGTIEVNNRCEVVDAAAHDLRNAAFHLLWHAKELTLDREPLTSDKL